MIYKLIFLISSIFILAFIFVIVSSLGVKKAIPINLINLLEKEKVSHFLYSNSGMDKCKNITIKDREFSNNCEGGLQDTQFNGIYEIILKSGFGEINVNFENEKIVFGEFFTETSLFSKLDYYYYISNENFCQNGIFDCKNSEKLNNNWYYSSYKLEKNLYR